MALTPVNQAEVWEAPFPYVDSVVVTGKDPQTGKTYVSFNGDIRPVVIVSNNVLNTSGEYVLACQMTTKIGRVLKRHRQLKQHVVRIGDKNEIRTAGLDAPSAVLPFKLVVIHGSQLRYRRGKLFSSTTSRILNEISKFF